MHKYKKIIYPAACTPIELLWDLRKRSGHYAREAKNLAQRNIRINKVLTIVSFSISTGILTALLLFQSELVTNTVVVWITIIGTAAMSLISIIQQFAFDAFTSVKTLSVSQKFSELKDSAKSVITLCEIEQVAEKTIMKRYIELSNKYHQLQERYIEHVQSHRSYYGFSRTPGKLKGSKLE